MTDTYLSDADWALRAYLRATLGPTRKVWSAFPTGTPTFPLIVIQGRVGGGPDGSVPVDNPRVSFQVWGANGGEGRKAMQDLTKLLVEALGDLENKPLDANTYAYGVSGINVIWLPDDSDPDNVLPRNIVDVSVMLREA